jgi:hypothetical protein
MQHRRVSITPERADELRVYPRVSLEMIGDAGAVLDFAEEMPERRRAEAVQMLDETLAPKASHRFCAQLRQHGHAAPNGGRPVFEARCSDALNSEPVTIAKAVMGVPLPGIAGTAG